MGVARVLMEVAEGGTVATVFDELSHLHPRLADARRSLRCAVDLEYASWDDPVHDQAEVAFIPPTAGG